MLTKYKKKSFLNKNNNNNKSILYEKILLYNSKQYSLEKKRIPITINYRFTIY